MPAPVWDSPWSGDWPGSMAAAPGWNPNWARAPASMSCSRCRRRNSAPGVAPRLNRKTSCENPKGAIRRIAPFTDSKFAPSDAVIHLEFDRMGRVLHSVDFTHLQLDVGIDEI